MKAISNAGFTMFDTQSKNSKMQKFQRDFDVDSSKSEKRAKSPIKNPIEPRTVQRKALDDQEVGKKNRGFDDQDVGYNKKRHLFDMTVKHNESPNSGRKKLSEPLSAAVFDQKKPDLKKTMTEEQPLNLAGAKKSDNKFGKKNKSMFVSLFRGTE